MCLMISAMNLFSKYLPIIIGATVIIGGLYFIGSSIYKSGFSAGSNVVQVKWDKAKTEQIEYITQLKNSYVKREKKYISEIKDIEYELASTKKEYSESLADIESQYFNRLQQSENRADIYKRKAESGTNECRNLASIASEFDRSIVTGRRVVKELTATVRQRDRELNLIGNQLITTRELCD